jgi:hypothetical protein
MALVFAALLIAFIYWFPARRWFTTWGTAAEDRERAMPGDAAVTHPVYMATLAVTIAAEPGCVWPWLAQIGYRRGGLYSYDWLDRLFGYLDRPSANRILPEYQTLKAGDEIPMGRGPGFPVTLVDAPRALVLSGKADGAEWAWQFGLYPLTNGHSRLVSRNQVRVPPGVGPWLVLRVIEPAAFLMTRRMLLGIAERAEAMAREAGPGSHRAE